MIIGTFRDYGCELRRVTPLTLLHSLVVEHPVEAEAICEHSKTCAPERSLLRAHSVEELHHSRLHRILRTNHGKTIVLDQLLKKLRTMS